MHPPGLMPSAILHDIGFMPVSGNHQPEAGALDIPMNHIIPNDGAWGSNPSCGTNKIKRLALIECQRLATGKHPVSRNWKFAGILGELLASREYGRPVLRNPAPGPG